jgi:hypothetical protein
MDTLMRIKPQMAVLAHKPRFKNVDKRVFKLFMDNHLEVKVLKATPQEDREDLFTFGTLEEMKSEDWSVSAEVDDMFLLFVTGFRELR